MKILEGYKTTEVGIIPDDWEIKKIKEVASIHRGASPRPIDSPIWFDENSQIGWVRISDVTSASKYLESTTQKLSDAGIKESRFVEKSKLIMSICASVGLPIITKIDVCIHDGFIVFEDSSINDEFLYYYLNFIKNNWSKHGQTGSQMNLNTNLINNTSIFYPANVAEQTAIAQVLSDTDELISSLEKLIEKKKLIKQGTMQQLLTGKKRLPGFSGEWEVKTIFDITDCLDNLRIPLNESQRFEMKGEYPYCGANGILDYINRYVIDDDIILIAEDGGYFDEYAYRPIAYRINGKCWVNNHAHILKAKKGFDQSYLFYSLVHKDIQRYLSSGTRAKLNRSEMNKIEINMPLDEVEQNSIGEILNEMDSEIESLEQKLN